MPKIYPSKVLLTVGDPSLINNMWFFDSRSFRFQLTTPGKSFALVRDGKCRSVVELAMHHRVQCSIDLRARGLYNGDGGPQVPTFVQKPGTPQRQHNHTCWVALPPSVPSTHHFHHPLPLHSSTPDLNLPFLQILPTVAYLFFFQTDSMDSPDCLPILLSISVLL